MTDADLCIGDVYIYPFSVWTLLAGYHNSSLSASEVTTLMHYRKFIIITIIIIIFVFFCTLGSIDPEG